MKYFTTILFVLLIGFAGCQEETQEEGPVKELTEAEKASIAKELAPEEKEQLSMEHRRRNFMNKLNDLMIQAQIDRSWVGVDLPEFPETRVEMAIRHVSEDFQIRYKVDDLREVDNWKVEDFRKEADTIISRISGGRLVEFKEFPFDAVNVEFNAPYGGAAFFENDSHFGEGFKYTQFLFLHKDKRANIYIYMMGNDPEIFKDMGKKMFYTMRFYN